MASWGLSLPDAVRSPAPRPDATADEFELERLIDQCLQFRCDRRHRNAQISESHLKALCQSARAVFLSQSTLLELEAPVKVLGDLHAQYQDLLRLFEFGGFPPESNYLFLGDYVDRGKQGIETIALLLAYKVKFSENMFLLRGNHETADVSRVYGFMDECKRRYNLRQWKTFCDVFNCMPVCALIDEKIFCMHGGLSPELLVPDVDGLDRIRRSRRPMDVPDQGLLADLLWADPDQEVQEWAPSDRGISYVFGKEVVTKVLRKYDMDLVVRAHQVVEDGYEFFAKRQLVTLFSAPNYMGEFDNAAGMMSIDESLMVSFKVLKPRKRLQGASGGRQVQ